MSPERALILRMLAVISEFHAPDRECRALRSIYSRRGICNVLPTGTHHVMCDEWINVMCDAREYLDEHPVDETRQLALIEVTAR